MTGRRSLLCAAVVATIPVAERRNLLGQPDLGAGFVELARGRGSKVYAVKRRQLVEADQNIADLVFKFLTARP